MASFGKKDKGEREANTLQSDSGQKTKEYLKAATPAV